jgi:hypothetical protein
MQHHHRVHSAGYRQHQRRIATLGGEANALQHLALGWVRHDSKYSRLASLIAGRETLSPLAGKLTRGYLLRRDIDIHVFRSDTLETHGPLGTLWVGLGLCAFYIALVWINTLLGFVLTPLFVVPLTWLLERVFGKAPVRG